MIAAIRPSDHSFTRLPARSPARSFARPVARPSFPPVARLPGRPPVLSPRAVDCRPVGADSSTARLPRRTPACDRFHRTWTELKYKVKDKQKEWSINSISTSGPSPAPSTLRHISPAARSEHYHLTILILRLPIPLQAPLQSSGEPPHLDILFNTHRPKAKIG